MTQSCIYSCFYYFISKTATLHNEKNGELHTNIMSESDQDYWQLRHLCVDFWNKVDYRKPKRKTGGRKVCCISFM